MEVNGKALRMAKIFINNSEIAEINNANYKDIKDVIALKTLLNAEEFYLTQHGKHLSAENDVLIEGNIQCVLRVRGGKGGFGSMLRAIGAQIEKTTNREACRDLSGRRLRDINEEKRLKAWLEKQGEREREAEERKKRKIEKLLTVPKHEFKDEEYEEARAKLTEKVNDAVEEGFKKVQEDDEPKTMKRKGAAVTAVKLKKKKKKSALWIGDDISDTDDSDSDSATDDEMDINSEDKKKDIKVKDSEATTDKVQVESECEIRHEDEESKKDVVCLKVEKEKELVKTQHITKSAMNKDGKKGMDLNN